MLYEFLYILDTDLNSKMIEDLPEDKQLHYYYESAKLEATPNSYLLDFIFVLIKKNGESIEEEITNRDWQKIINKAQNIALKHNWHKLNQLISSLDQIHPVSSIENKSREEFIAFLKSRNQFSMAKAKEEWRKAFSEIVDLHEDRHAWSIGIRRIQIVYMPSFETGHAWDFREIDGIFKVYRSEIGKFSKLYNYTAIDFPSKISENFIKYLQKLKLRISPIFVSEAGLDGTTTELAFFGDLHSGFRFRWWSNPPPNWKKMTGYTEKIIEQLFSSSVIQKNTDQMVEELFNKRNDLH